MADARLRIQVGVSGTAEVAAGLQSIQAAAGRLKGGLLAIGTALAGAAGLGALGQAAIATAKLGDELGDLSARTGISARALVTLRQAFKDAGLGADSVGSTINRLQKTIVEAATSGGTAADALASIGMSAQGLSALAPEDQFAQVAAAISAVQNPAERSAAAMGIFGKSGAELLPLFADGGALDNAEKVLGRMPEILGRNVGVLGAISDSFDRLPNKATQLFAGILDQIGPTVLEILKAFESIDLTQAGQNLGAFVMVAIDEFKAGRFGEFLALTIEAGTQIGIRKSKEIIRSLWDTFTDQNTANAIGGFTVTLIGAFGKAIVDIDTFWKAWWRSIVVFMAEMLVSKLAEGFNKVIGSIEATINRAIKAANLLTGKSEFFGIQPQTIPRIPTSAPEFDKTLAEEIRLANAEGSVLKTVIDGFVNSYKDFFGIKREAVAASGEQSEAEKEILRLINEQKRKVDEIAKARSFEQVGPPPAPLTQINTRLELQRLENQYNRDLLDITQRRSLVESTWLMTANEKYKQRKASLEQELDLIDQQRLKLLQLREQAQPSEQQAIDQQMFGLRGRAAGIQTEMGAMGPSPESFSENFQATVVQLQNQFGSVAQQMAQTFADVFNAAIQSISNGITGLIMGTMSWGQALMSIATTILTTIVQSIVQMGVRWIATQILMATVGKSIAAASVAATVPIALAQSAVWATPATLATIASYGSAAAAAPGFIAASQGIVLAQSLAAFREGGYTGDGDPNDVAGLVHRGEFVVPADAVDRIGLSTLEALSAGNAEAIQTSSQAPAPITLNMGVFDDPRRLSDWARSNEGRTVLVDILRQHAHEFTGA